MAVRRTGVNAATGTYTLGPLNAAKNMDALETSRVVSGTLTARVYWSVLTNAMTLTGKWQGSADNSTWRDIVDTQNPAHVVLQTSTGTGAKYIAAPSGVNGLPFVRFSLVSGAASGTVGDTYSLSYAYVAKSPFESVTQW